MSCASCLGRWHMQSFQRLFTPSVTRHFKITTATTVSSTRPTAGTEKPSTKRVALLCPRFVSGLVTVRCLYLAVCAPVDHVAAIAITHRSNFTSLSTTQAFMLDTLPSALACVHYVTCFGSNSAVQLLTLGTWFSCGCLQVLC